MKSRFPAAGAVLLAALLVVLFNSSVSSCVPTDSGKCEFVRKPVRISLLGGGGKANATIILTNNQDTLEQNLREFAQVPSKSAWDYYEFDYNTSAITGGNVVRPANYALHVQELDADQLARTQARIYDLAHVESVNPFRRLPLITQELERRLPLITQMLARPAPVRPLALAPKILLPLGKTIAIKSASKPAAVPQPAPVAIVPGSPDPYNAPMPSGQQVYISPQTSVWYNISDRGRRLSLMMDADRNLGLTMAVFGPDVQDVWNDRPTGQGAPGGGFAYFWTGRSRFKGIWKIRITNPNDFSVPYTLIGANISDKNGDLCRDCHGNIEDEWDRCDHDGSFCDDLKDQYRE